MELKIPCGQKKGETTFCAVSIEKEGTFTDSLARNHPDKYFQYQIEYFNPDSSRLMKSTFVMNTDNYNALISALDKNKILARRLAPRLLSGRDHFQIEGTSSNIFLATRKERAESLRKAQEQTESWIHDFDQPLKLTLPVKQRNGAVVERTLSLPKVPAMSLELYREKAEKIGRNYVAVFAKTPAQGAIKEETIVFLLRRDRRNLNNDQMWTLNQQAVKAGIINDKDDESLANLFIATDANPASLDPLNPNPEEYYLTGTVKSPFRQNRHNFQVKIENPILAKTNEELKKETEALLDESRKDVLVMEDKGAVTLEKVPVLEVEELQMLVKNPRRAKYIRDHYTPSYDYGPRGSGKVFLLTKQQFSKHIIDGRAPTVLDSRTPTMSVAKPSRSSLWISNGSISVKGWNEAFSKEFLVTYYDSAKNRRSLSLGVEVPTIEYNDFQNAWKKDLVNKDYLKDHFMIAAETAPKGDPNRKIVLFFLDESQMRQMNQQAYRLGILKTPEDSIFIRQSFIKGTLTGYKISGYISFPSILNHPTPKLKAEIKGNGVLVGDLQISHFP